MFWRLLCAATNVILVVLITAVVVRLGLAVVEQLQRQSHPPPGQVVELADGRLIHLRFWGEDNPGPTVILEAAANSFSSFYGWLGPALGDEYRVVAYDRPGMGWSVGRSGPPDAAAAAEALREALELAGMEPPYVVVGHSYGGLVARVFAGRNRAETVGLALLDSSHPEQGGWEGHAIFYRWRALLGHTGVYHLANPAGGTGLPPEEAERVRVVSIWTSQLDASAEELEAWASSIEQVRAAGTFGDMPLLVVSADRGGFSDAVAQQEDLARISSAGRLVTLSGVGHMTMVTEPEQAALVETELKDFLRSLP
ncbi:MAG TPA: alpha/beta hydrolase [Candidatus Limnocylindria bacterium]|nr:alpha/beta hydrolase [Candidatus Limnocylindria bacterium]